MPPEHDAEDELEGEALEPYASEEGEEMETPDPEDASEALDSPGHDVVVPEQRPANDRTGEDAFLPLRDPSEYIQMSIAEEAAAARGEGDAAREGGTENKNRKSETPQKTKKLKKADSY